MPNYNELFKAHFIKRLRNTEVEMKKKISDMHFSPNFLLWKFR